MAWHGILCAAAAAATPWVGLVGERGGSIEEYVCPAIYIYTVPQRNAMFGENKSPPES